LKKFYEILEKRVLDKNDAKVLFILTEETFESLTLKNHLPKETMKILQE
jgi:hypothetical protein